MNDTTSSHEESSFELNAIPAEEVAQEITRDTEDAHVDPATPPEPALEALVTRWRVAKALERLRVQVNQAFPNRSKASDGTIGDIRHQSRASDHNPWIVDGGIGVVTALDITHDPAHGCDAGKLAEAIRSCRDSRVKYIISNRRIASSQAVGAAAPWAWRTYTGSNPHNHHCHISVKSDKAAYDNEADWDFRSGGHEAVAAADGETMQEQLVGAALDALPGMADRPVFERLIDAQDEIARLLSSYAVDARPIRAEDAQEAARPRFEDLKSEYETLWDSCVIRSERAASVAWHVARLQQNRERYEQVSAATGAPWEFIGAVHALEASFNFQGHLHNGDPLRARTVNVPANRPLRWNPPNDWLSSAIDAITFEGFAGQSDWSIARVLYRFEGYNGFSYRTKGINSPYLWSFSTHYTKGKFVRDHVYDPNSVSAQCGAAVMLKALNFGGQT